VYCRVSSVVAICLCSCCDLDDLENEVQSGLKFNKLSCGLGKQALMHVRKVSSQISLCSPLRLISDDIFR
jgi:hypothetical protein